MYCGVEVVRLNYHVGVLWSGGTVIVYCGVKVVRLNYHDSVLWSGGSVIVLR
jgi:hypothetical protein